MATTLILTLDDAVLARIRAAAAAVGLSPEAWAAGVITTALATPGLSEDAVPFDATARDHVFVDTRTPETVACQHTAALAALTEYDQTGEHVTFEEWAAEFRTDVEARLAAR